MSMERLTALLDLPQESSPVWLDGGEKIAYIRRDKQGTHIWTYHKESGERRRITEEDRRVWKLDSNPHTGSLLLTYDADGDECEQIYLWEKDSPRPVNVSKTPGVRHLFGGTNKDDSVIAFASNKRTAETFDIWKYERGPDRMTLVTQFTDHYNWPIQNALSPNGKYLLYNKLKSQADNSLWMSDLDSGEAVRIPNDTRLSAEPKAVFTSDSQHVYLVSDRQGEFFSLYKYSLADESLDLLYSFEWDIEGIALSGDDKYLAVFLNEEGYTRFSLYDMEENGREIKVQALPPGVVSSASWSPKEALLLFSFTSGAKPQAIYTYDVETDTFERVSADDESEAAEEKMVEPELYRYDSFDGLSVPFWLYRPGQVDTDKLPPLVIDIHGGPEGQKRPTFDFFIQYLVSEGIQVVAPNVRGSTGYGKTYHHLDDVEKRLDSVKDIEALVRYLVKNKLADPDKIAVSGASYGGFMTLSCAARYPDLFACAVDTVGMYNLVTFLENTSDYRRLHRENEYGSLAEHRDLLYEVSPVAVIHRIKAPLMVIQGRNDPRVPASESEQLVEKLRSSGKEVEYLCYEDEGHGIVKRKNRLDCYPRIVAFLAKHLLN